MKRFVWRLQRVLEVKTKEEEKKRSELLEITEILAQTRADLIARQRVIEDIISNITRENPKKRLIEQEFFFKFSATSIEKIEELKNKIQELESKQREKINEKLQAILDKQTDPWGIKVANVEVKHVDISEDLRRAMARQAEAERERRAKVIAAEGEFEAAEKICQAAEKMQEIPVALQLRYLQTLVEIGSESGTKTLIPIPIDILNALKDKVKG